MSAATLLHLNIASAFPSMCPYSYSLCYSPSSQTLCSSLRCTKEGGGEREGAGNEANAHHRVGW